MIVKILIILSLISHCTSVYIHAANSKKVVFQKSKIQITNCKIQEKVCHITHMSRLLTSSP